MKRFKTGILSAILPTVMLVLTLALSSCAKESLPDSGEFGEGEATVTLELVPPGAFSEVQTRVLTDAQQNAINRATVLIFKNDVVAQQMVATKVEGNKMTVNGIKTSQSESDKYDIVVLGNSPADLPDYLGKSKEELRTAVELNIALSDKWTGTEFMMWGEASQVLVHTLTNTFQIQMLRSLARIDVGLGTYNEATPGAPWSGLSNFKLTEVQVLGTSDMFAVVPEPAKIDLNGKVTAPSFPKNTGTLNNAISYSGAQDITDETYIQSTIFVPETASTLTNPVKLIIGGKYDGSSTTTYYRVDICLPKEGAAGEYIGLDILRNHLYRISITSIAGLGYASADEAAKLPALNNIAIELNPIDEGGSGDIIFDAHSSIATDASDIIIHGYTNGVKEYTIVNVKAVYASGIKVQVTGTGLVGPVVLQSGILTPIKVHPEADVTGGSVTITVGRLEKEIKYLIQPPLDAHFDFLPFQNVASISVVAPQPWLTMSHKTTYVKDEQEAKFILGDLNGKAVVHFDENIATTGAPRTAEARVLRNNNHGTTRLIFEQLNLSGMVIGRFGGAKDGSRLGYTQLLAVESVEEFLERTYDDPSVAVSGTAGVYWGFKTTTTSVNDIELGKAGTITLAKRSDSGIDNPDWLVIPHVARYCYDKNRDTNGSGTLEDSEIVWYLPAQNQLMGAWIAHHGISAKFTGNMGSYWSVTEATNFNSFGVHFFLGESNHIPKSNSSPVRCVRDI